MCCFGLRLAHIVEAMPSSAAARQNEYLPHQLKYPQLFPGRFFLHHSPELDNTSFFFLRKRIH